MSKFLEILKEALSDPKYGWESEKTPRPPEPKGCYGNEDCLKQWWDRERKDYF